MIYGWQGADGVTRWVYDNPPAWGLTERKAAATRFPDIQACKNHYLSKLAFPEDYKNNELIYEGQLELKF